MQQIRPGHILFLTIVLLIVVDTGLYLNSKKILKQRNSWTRQTNILSSALGLTDLCIATEARYTRHPSISDPISPFMDHPGALEHFPSGSFWGVPEQITASSRRKS
ncbi:MAG: hypothetical protein KKG47_07800 [Proteobacteria bacterium]|nr:hypothetical protein [Pseudomonadota bacterium]MBU1739371.1 hypothetical protein [Pseudomonadota bacterium]